MSNHVRIRDRKRGGPRSLTLSRFRKSRGKSFKSEESAKAYAEKEKITDYKLVNLKSLESKTKKIKIV